jgi:uncharacterized integral membrane protein
MITPSARMCVTRNLPTVTMLLLDVMCGGLIYGLVLQVRLIIQRQY